MRRGGHTLQRLTFACLLAAAAVFGPVSVAHAATGASAALPPPAPQNPIGWSVAKTPASATAGETFKIEVTATIERGWHLYSIAQQPPPIATRISIPKDQPFSLDGKIQGPAPQTAFDQGFGMDTEFYTEKAVFTVPVKVGPAASGKQVLHVEAYYQTCNDKFCLPPRTAKMETPIEVTGSAATASSADGPATAAPITPPATPALPSFTPSIATAAAPFSAPASPAQSGSLFSFLLLAMVSGALALLTPCVFPMVPITVSYFTGHAANRQARALRNASIYAVGIILTFTAFGLVLALLVGATSLNRFAANPWINLLITAIFIGFALNLFGVFEINIPSGILTRLDGVTRQEGGSEVVGALLMGFTFTLTSFTCTVPFVGNVMVAASGGSWAQPVVGMLAFAAVFALPFFVLALMPQWAAQLPRSGAWMHAVKVLMAFLEIAAAMKFISNVDLIWRWGIFTRDVVLAIWVVIAASMALYLLGVFRFPGEPRIHKVRAGRWALAAASILVGVWLFTGVMGRRLGELDAFLPPADGVGAFAASMNMPAFSDELPWIMNDYDGALALARREGKRVVVDFTGYTCTNCRWMEANMFPRDDVRAELSKYVRLRMYTDGDGEIFQKQQALQEAMFKTVALPYYAILDANGRPVSAFPGLTRSPAEFVAFLKKGLS